MVWDSWRRSLGSGVDPDAVAAPVDLLDDDLASYRDAHPLAAVMPVIRRLLVADAEADKMIVAVADAAGRILWVEGDRRLRSQAEGMHFVAGSRWSEDVVGTNAPAPRWPSTPRADLRQRALQPHRAALELLGRPRAPPGHRPAAGRHRRHRRRPRGQPGGAHPGAGHRGRRGVRAALAAPRAAHRAVRAPAPPPAGTAAAGGPRPRARPADHPRRPGRPLPAALRAGAAAGRGRRRRRGPHRRPARRRGARRRRRAGDGARSCRGCASCSARSC